MAWRDGARFVARLAPPTLPPPSDARLVSSPGAGLNGLTWAPAPARSPGPGEIRIALQASGLNFRDVMNALGLLGPDAGPLGAEGAGVVVEAGEGAPWVVGQPIMALVAGIGQSATLDARLAAPIPPGLAPVAAATVPLVFLTALYALRDLAHVQPGQTVLIHAAAGGVGLAAVQVARWLGAEVVATASAPKWPVLRKLGIEHIASSRDTDFAQAFSELPIDVVLNGLTDDKVDAGLSLLRPGGWFLELGKTDVRDPARWSSSGPGCATAPLTCRKRAQTASPHCSRP